MNERDLVAFVFGEDAGPDARVAARASDLRFVRGIDALAEDNPAATGPRLSALEALSAYGLEVLATVKAEGVARLAPNGRAAGAVLQDRREKLRLTPRNVARTARVSEPEVEAAEACKRLPVRVYESIARALGLDERYISVREHPEGNEDVAVRLRAIGDVKPGLMTRHVVATLAEAAWVAATQLRLEEELGLRPDPPGIEHNPSYGTPDFKPYQWGYYLADEARERLGLGRGPIESLRVLAEIRLGIPVIHAPLGDDIAGVTLEIGARRAIVLSTQGKNLNVYVRRSTIAHELGHLLYDPPKQLKALRVDEYVDLARRPDDIDDLVERRANAFSVQFVAPQEEALAAYHEAGGSVGAVMHRFRISFTAARYQIWNGLERGVPLESLEETDLEPRDDAKAAESFTLDYHPLDEDHPAGRMRESRSGRFVGVVVRAADEGLISWDTAASWLEVPNIEARAEAVREFYPELFTHDSIMAMGPLE